MGLTVPGVSWRRHSTANMTDRTIKIGYLRDVYVTGSHDFGGNALRMVIDDANRAGGLHGREVDLVTRLIERSPGTHDNVVDACEAWNDIVHGEQVVFVFNEITKQGLRLYSC
jgi:ABC-type branched-subunit amino acid transport system substrate-binding protein